MKIGGCGPYRPANLAGVNGNGFRMKGEASDSPAARRSPSAIDGSLALAIGTTQCGDRAPPVRQPLNRWITLEAERVLYVDRGRDVILCDRGHSGSVTLVVKISDEERAMAWIEKADFNLLVELFNRRAKSDVIGIPDDEFQALGRAIDLLRCVTTHANETSVRGK